MELKPGYQQTEVGVIPQDWETGKLEEYFSFISYGFTNPMPSTTSGVYMITAADISDGRIQYETARCTTVDAYQNLLTPKSKPKKNDILLTKDGTLGRLALVGDETLCINQSVAIIRPNGKVIPAFLKLLLESPVYQRKMLEDAGGSTIKHIYITIVNLMTIALPRALDEQHVIVAALSDMDALITALDRLIAKKRDIKQAAMQELLTGKRRLPGFSGEWEVRELKEIVTQFIVPMRDKPKSFRGNIPWCRIEDFDGKLLFDSKSKQYVDDEIIKAVNLRVHPTGTLLVSCSADLGRCAIVGRPLVTNQTFIGLVFDDDTASNEFMYYYMTFHAEELNNLSSGTTISYLSIHYRTLLSDG